MNEAQFKPEWMWMLASLVMIVVLSQAYGPMEHYRTPPPTRRGYTMVPPGKPGVFVPASVEDLKRKA